MDTNQRKLVKVLPRAAILVLGMHRSGTSAFTRTASLLGASFPSNLMPPSPGDNEKGFWESVDIYRLNNEILGSAGSSWDDWRRFNPDWFQSNVAAAFGHTAQEILDRDFGSSSLFVLKDPRICRLLPFWVDVIRQANVEPRCLIPIRNPLEVAESLRCRNGFSLVKSLILWLRHVLDAEQDSRFLRRAFASYEGLLADWRGEVFRFSAALDLVWPRRSVSAELEIDAFLENRLRHHVIGQDRVTLMPAVAVWIKDAYSAFVALQIDPGSKGALARLDTIREEFDRASAILGAIAKESELAACQLQTELVQRDTCLAEISAELARRSTCLAKVNAELAQCDTRLAEVGAALTERDTQLDIVVARLDHRDALVRRLRSDLDEGHRHNQALTKLRNQLLLRLSDIQQSVSWQLTRPVRTLGRWWPNLARGASGLVKLGWWGITLRLTERLRLRRQAMMLLEQKLFDPTWYIERNPDIVLQGLNPIMHWLIVGWKQRRDPSPLFDSQWYLQQSPDVAAVCVNPLLHYLEKGAIEGRTPHPLFDGPWYLDRYPDAASTSMDPLVHYLSRHPRERRDPHPLFDASWYLDQDRSVAASGVNALFHYLVWGGTRGRNPNRFFDSAWYLEQYREVARAGINPLLHYVRWGAWEGKNPSPRFDTTWYLQQHPELAETRTNPLAHFLRKGIALGWPPHPSEQASSSPTPNAAADTRTTDLSANGPSASGESSVVVPERLQAGFRRNSVRRSARTKSHGA
jgi:hypothetical protein